MTATEKLLSLVNDDLYVRWLQNVPFVLLIRTGKNNDFVILERLDYFKRKPAHEIESRNLQGA